MDWNDLGCMQVKFRCMGVIPQHLMEAQTLSSCSPQDRGAKQRLRIISPIIIFMDDSSAAM
jgi:hypothetical protein